MNALHGLINRRDQRFSVFVAATLASDGCTAPVTIRNISRSGATLRMPTTPPVGAEVVLVRGTLRGKARVVWAIERRVGLISTQPIYVDAWIAPPVNASQQRADQIFSGRNVVAGEQAGQALLGRQEPAARNDQQIADVIALLAQLEERLSNDGIVVSQHGQALQNLD